MKWLDIIGMVIPIFLEWLRIVFTNKDEEFERIAKAWPYPTKTKLARLRAEMKASEHFGVDVTKPAEESKEGGE